jgi:hypothetical protein
MSRLTGWRRRLPVSVGVVSAVTLGAGALLLLLAGLVAFVEGRVVLGLAAAGAAASAAALGIEARRMMSRISHLATLEEVDRFALQAMAGDAAQQTRRLDRLAGTSERGVRAGLAVRVLREQDPESKIDPSLLAGILALAPRQVVLVADDASADGYTRALADLSPSTAVLRLPAEQHVGAFFDRLAARRRTTGAPVPLVAASGYSAVHATVWGATAAHFLERFGVEEFLVLVPPGSHAVLDDPPRNTQLRAAAVGSACLLVKMAGDAKTGDRAEA